MMGSAIKSGSGFKINKSFGYDFLALQPLDVFVVNLGQNMYDYIHIYSAWGKVTATLRHALDMHTMLGICNKDPSYTSASHL